VDVGTFHDFHHAWICELSRLLNNRLLPRDYYALIEQRTHGLASAVATVALSNGKRDAEFELLSESGSATELCVAPPLLEFAADGETAYYRRKQNRIVVRHVERVRAVAIVEIVSRADKSSPHGFNSFLRKACELFDHDIHLLVLDLHRPGPRDPHGIHGAIWDYFQGQPYAFPLDRPITLAAYECDLCVRAYVQQVAIGDSLPAMPLFLQPRGHILVPLEESYQAAFEAVPRVWRTVLE
jgi:hypothetical protein